MLAIGQSAAQIKPLSRVFQSRKAAPISTRMIKAPCAPAQAMAAHARLALAAETTGRADESKWRHMKAGYRPRHVRRADSHHARPSAGQAQTRSRCPLCAADEYSRTEVPARRNPARPAIVSTAADSE